MFIRFYDTLCIKMQHALNLCFTCIQLLVKRKGFQTMFTVVLIQGPNEIALLKRSRDLDFRTQVCKFAGTLKGLCLVRAPLSGL
jgi:hypothetical protein